MKQYVAKKAIWRGFKVWVLADSDNGYFVDVDIYVGRSSDETVERDLASRVVLKLTESYRNKHHQLFCDNFFTSPALFYELHRHGVYVCGTVRSDRRGFPADLKWLRLERGSHEFRQRGNLGAVVWQDKRQVCVLSTMHNPADTTQVQRKEKNGTRTTLSCPTSIVSYNQKMAGVD